MTLTKLNKGTNNGKKYAIMDKLDNRDSISGCECITLVGVDVYNQRKVRGLSEVTWRVESAGVERFA